MYIYMYNSQMDLLQIHYQHNALNSISHLLLYQQIPVTPFNAQLEALLS